MCREFSGMRSYDQFLKDNETEPERVMCQVTGEMVYDYDCQKIGRYYYSNDWLKKFTPEELMDLYANDPEMREKIIQAKNKI